MRLKLTFLILLFVPAFAWAQQSMSFQIRFDRNKYNLSRQSREILTEIADSVLGREHYVIYISGHADSDADSSYNWQLSLNRSIAVRDFLREKGVIDSSMRVQALGEEQPLVANATPLGKANNRRVELLILFPQEPWRDNIEPSDPVEAVGCVGDTTVQLEGGYKLTLSKCDWERNATCLRVEKKLRYKIKVKENWLKKHIGFKNYKKAISYEPHYEFVVLSCIDSCFQQPATISVPHYQAPGLRAGFRYSQKRNDKGNTSGLVFRNRKTSDSAYYVASIYCPGSFYCGTDNRCSHDFSLRAQKRISILSYSYLLRSRSSYFDSLVTVHPDNQRKIVDNYRHGFFVNLTIEYGGDTLTLNNLPIDIFAHGRRKIKSQLNPNERSYFLFIPFRKKYRCGHYRKYKFRTKDIRNLMQFNIDDLPIEY